MGELTRNPDGTFPAGVSGNPRGRPPSKRNQITDLKQDLEIAIRRGVRPAQIQSIVDKMVELAQEGSVGAAKLILDKTVSNAKDVEEVKSDGGGVRVIIENVTVGRETKTIEAEDAEYTELEDE
jgi:hypothetical protein